MPQSAPSNPKSQISVAPAVREAIQRLGSEGIPATLTIERLPLAVYREIVAQLQLLDALEVTLLPQPSTTFDYLQSQVGGIQVCVKAGHHDQMDQPASQKMSDRLLTILQHYAERFGPWNIAQ